MTTHKVRSWLGVPYAKAERFSEPELVPFDETKQYVKYGPAPLQAGDTSWLGSDSGLSEDCLNLNIWAPEDVGEEPLPVVVYIFGGGWVLGSNTQSVSNVSGLASTGRVIGVSINYRLGPFGWLSLAQYGGKLKDATNLGLKDIIMALKWIQNNITYFGGDANNVTVTGHSAGAFSSLALLSAPSADNLYHHLAAFSGMPSRLVPQWVSQERALKVLKHFDCVNNPEHLLQVDAYELAEAMNATQSPDPGTPHGVDNDVIAVTDDSQIINGVIADHPMHVLESGKHKDVDILFSSTTEETFYWVLHRTKDFDPVTLDRLAEQFAHSMRIPLTRAHQVINSFTDDTLKPVEVRGLLLTHLSFTLPQIRGALAHANAGGTSHLLVVGPVKGAEVAIHGTEMSGIVGRISPNASQEQIDRDNYIKDTLLNMAEGHSNLTWDAVKVDKISAKGIGNMPYNAIEHSLDILEIFKGIDRP